MGIFSASIIYVLAFTSFNTGRMRISMGATIGMLFILVYTETTIFEKKNVYLYLLTNNGYWIFNNYNNRYGILNVFSQKSKCIGKTRSRNNK